MSKLILFAKLSMAAFVAANVVSVAAQEPPKRPDTKASQVRKEGIEQRNPGDQANTTEENVSRMLASCVAISNQHELAVCRFSVGQIENAKIKQFAEMLIDEHTKCAEKLAQSAPESASMKLDASGKARREASSKESKIQQTSGNKDDAKPQRDAAKSTDPQRNDVTNAVNRETATAKHQGVPNEDHLISIERQVAEECLSLQSKELNEAKKAGNFDEAFLRCQIGAHLAMLAKLSVYEGATEGELAQLFKEGRATTEKHLAEAKNLIAEVAGK